jgi:hypothetical protein
MQSRKSKINPPLVLLIKSQLLYLKNAQFLELTCINSLWNVGITPIFLQSGAKA